MSQDSARPTRRSTGLWVLIGVILVPAVVIPLWVPLYDKTDPTLWGFAMILMAAALTVIAYVISQIAERRRRGEGR